MVTYETRQTFKEYHAWTYRNEGLGRLWCGDCARPDEMIPVERSTYFPDTHCYVCDKEIGESTPIKITVTENYTLEHVACKIF